MYRLRSENPEYWKWLCEEKHSDPIVSLLQRTEPAKLDLKLWKEQHKEDEGKTRPEKETSNWKWNAGMTMYCDFCDFWCNPTGCSSRGVSHGSWTYRPWDEKEYCVACFSCKDLLTK